MESPANDLAPFLRPSRYCDFEHPFIARQARKLSDGRASDKQKAIAAFEWVRDNIEYIMGVWDRTASALLFDRQGSCSTKTTLFIALCRSMGIPAAYHVMKVNGKAYYGQVIGPQLANLCGDVSVHFYAAVYLEGRWIKCDVSDDRRLCESIGHLNPQTSLVEFDGEHDAMLKLLPEHIYADSERLASIDDRMDKPRRISDSLVKLLNCGISFCRNYGKWYQSADEGFSDWLVFVQSAYPDELAQCLQEFARQAAEPRTRSATPRLHLARTAQTG